MSKIIEIIEENNELKLLQSDAKIICGNSNYKLKFTFSDDWKKATHKAVVFCVCGKKITQTMVYDECEVPVLHGGGVLFISLVAGDEGNELATTAVKIDLVETFSNVDFVEFEPLRNDLSSLLDAVNNIERGNIAVKKAEIANNVRNPNLLINGDFSINQRGQESYTGNNVYTVDRWNTQQSTKITPITTGINIKTIEYRYYSIIRQKPEIDVKKYIGQSMTVSAKVRRTATQNLQLRLQFFSDSSYETRVGNISTPITEEGVFSCSMQVPEGAKYVMVDIYKNTLEIDDIDIDYIKLEFGLVATAYHPRTYAEELALCQRYYWKSTSSLGTTYYGYSLTDSTVRMTIVMPNVMRTAPTISSLNVDDIGIIGAGQQLIASSYAYQSYSSNGTVPQITYDLTCPNTKNNAYIIRLIQEFSLDAEIY